MAETVKIIELARIGNMILVTFSDGRITTLSVDQLYASSVDPPPYPDGSGEIESN
jgi:hypothetical protein